MKTRNKFFDFQGLPTNRDRDEWKKFQNENMKVNGNIWRQFNDKVMKQGLPPLPKLSFIHTSDFGDQFDNVHRIVEKNVEIHFNAYYYSEEESLESIDRLLNDKELAQKLRKISERIQSSESTVKASQLIESLVIK
jgi:UDP:flavonoid glycosyltransferase YjiC (YdhE family)